MTICIRYTQSFVRERRRRGGWGAPARWLRCGGAGRRSRPCAHGDKKSLGSKGVSAPRGRMRCRFKLGNYACERRNVERGNRFSE
eukprot:3734519-Pleurochrysis_carterae.AAC.2